MRGFFESGFVDNAICSSSENLLKFSYYFGTELVEISNIFLPGFDEEIFFDDQFFHQYQKLYKIITIPKLIFTCEKKINNISPFFR